MDGKSIMTIPASSAIPFIKTIADHKDELAEELGFKHAQWENQGNPTQWIQGIEFASNNGFDLISPAGRRRPALLRAAGQGGAGQGAEGRDLASDGAGAGCACGRRCHTAIDYKQAGKLMADWTIAKTDGKSMR